MAIVWPHVVQYLVDTLPTLPGWDQVYVSDGPMNTRADPGDVALVGHVTDDTAGSFTLLHEYDYLMTEDGVVRVELTCKTGADSLVLMRTRAFVLLDALDAHLRADQTLGGLLTNGVSAWLSAGDVLSVVGSGAAQNVVCTVSYHTETPFPG